MIYSLQAMERRETYINCSSCGALIRQNTHERV